MLYPRDTRVEEAFQKIEEGVKDVYTSDNFVNYLKLLSKFHNYSFNNVILILSQHPGASLVAGYSKWQNEFNRHVNKGEKAIKILAPYQVDLKKMLESMDEDGNKVESEEVVKVTRFKVVNVFDLSQTSGEPLPELINDLRGSSYNARALIESICLTAKILIEFIPPENDFDLRSGAKGYYSVTEDKIVVNRDLDEIQIAKTLAHEYAHSLLHKDTKKDRNQREIEAESLAFVVCNYFGIDTSDYSFGYIASYSQQDTEQLKKILQNIQNNAKEIIQTLEPVFQLRLADLQIENKYFSPVEMEEFSKPLIKEMLKDIEQTPLFESLKNIEPSDIRYGKDSIDIEINELMSKYKDEYPLQVALYEVNANFRAGFQAEMYNRCLGESYSERCERPFIEHSLEYRNYCALEKMGAPILNGECDYIRMTSKGFMDFSIDRVMDDHVAIAHYGYENNDAMADPDICCLVDRENHLLIPETFHNDYTQVYQTTAEDPSLTDELSSFMVTWLENIKENRYKIAEIKTEELYFTQPKDIYKYCRENGIKEFAKKPQEKEAR